MDLTYTICSNYHKTTKVAYCVPYLHNMLPLSRYYQGSILCTSPTQYAYITKMLPRWHIVYLNYTICSDYHITTRLSYYLGSILCTLPTQYAPIVIILLREHIVYFTYTICSNYHNTTEVAFWLPYLNNMLPLS